MVDCPPLPAPVYVDRDMWEKIVLNLVSNAVKFTFDGEIRVRVRATDKAAVLEVTDTGVGIAPEELPQVFEPPAIAALHLGQVLCIFEESFFFFWDRGRFLFDDCAFVCLLSSFGLFCVEGRVRCGRS